MSEPFESYAILELMGHKRLVGFVRDVEMFGGRMLCMDCENIKGEVITKFYGLDAIYCLTPTDEKTVKRLQGINEPAPINAYELPMLQRQEHMDFEEDEVGF